MANTRDIVDRYLSALYSGDAPTARRYLADDLSFTGPAASFTNADQYLRATEHAVRAVSGIEKLKTFVDGAEACIFYELHLAPPLGSVLIADWYHLEGDKIASIRTIFDTAPFISPTASTTETATDPVCGMSVAKASAAASRTFAEQTYFFCNTGCAEAFDAQPERYAVGG